MRIPLAASVVLLAGCAGTTRFSDPGPRYAPPALGAQPGGTCLPVVPMQLVVMHHGYAKPMAWLTPDGTILGHGRQQPAYLGRIANDQVFGPSGQPEMTCLPNRALATPGMPQGGWFTPQDEYTDQTGTVIGIGPDGTVYMGRQGAMGPGIARMEGGWPAARRTAVVLVIQALAAGFSRPMTERVAPAADERVAKGEGSR